MARILITYEHKTVRHLSIGRVNVLKYLRIPRLGSESIGAQECFVSEAIRFQGRIWRIAKQLTYDLNFQRTSKQVVFFLSGK